MSTPATWRIWGQRIGIAATVLAGSAVVLWLMGRTPWGAAAGPGLWTGDPRGRLTSQLLFDPYSLTHVSHGLLFFYLFAVALARYSREVQFSAALVLEAAWELVENTPYVIDRFRQTTAATEYTGDSILNSLGDILSAVIGFAIAVQVVKRTRRGWVLLLFLAAEGISALWIRDGMLLTTLMLVYPIPEIRQWQAG